MALRLSSLSAQVKRAWLTRYKNCSKHETCRLKSCACSTATSMVSASTRFCKVLAPKRDSPISSPDIPSFHARRVALVCPKTSKQLRRKTPSQLYHDASQLHHHGGTWQSLPTPIKLQPQLSIPQWEADVHISSCTQRYLAVLSAPRPLKRLMRSRQRCLTNCF